MKKSEVKVGGYYRTSILGFVTVRVEKIESAREVYPQNRVVVSYFIKNLQTGRKLTIQDAQFWKFRFEVNESGVPI